MRKLNHRDWVIAEKKFDMTFLKILCLLLVFSTGLSARADAQAQSTVGVNTHAALANLLTSTLPSGTTSVIQYGYYVAGDMPPVIYTLKTFKCNLDSGSGDGGAQIPANVPSGSGCWMLGHYTVYDLRWWGAMPGGTDPNFVNASSTKDNGALINKAISYIGSLGSLTTPGLTPLTGGGLVYGINRPVVLGIKFFRFYGLTLIALSSQLFPGATTAMVEVANTGSTETLENIVLNANFLPINGMAVMSNGSIHADDINVEHWEGSYASKVVAVTSANKNVLKLAHTTGLKLGMVSRGNKDIPNLSVIVGLTSTTVALSQAVTGAVSGNMTFYSDPSGIVIGLNNSNGGGTYSDISSSEWQSVDPEVGNPDDYYGFSLSCTGQCNDIALSHGLYTNSIVPIEEDSQIGGIHIDAGTEIDNEAWTSQVMNPACILQTDGAGAITGTDIDLGGCSIQTYSVASDPSDTFGHLRFTAAPNSNITPPDLVQVWSSMTGTDAALVTVNPFDSNIPLFYLPVGTYGPGTFAVNPNQTNYAGGAILNFTEGDEVYHNSTTLSVSDCGYSIQIGNEATPVTVQLPQNIPGVLSSSSCIMRLEPQGPAAVTLAPAGSALINGSAASITLNNDQGYLIWSAGNPGTGTGALGGEVVGSSNVKPKSSRVVTTTTDTINPSDNGGFVSYMNAGNTVAVSLSNELTPEAVDVSVIGGADVTFKMASGGYLNGVVGGKFVAAGGGKEYRLTVMENSGGETARAYIK